MSNGKYRAEKVKDLNWEKLNQTTQDHAVVFSVDVAKEDMYGALMIEKDDTVVILKWKHPIETLEIVKQIRKRLKCKSLVVALEPSGTYGDPVIHQFRQFGVDVYRVSPKKTFDAKELYDGVPSLHDGKSAYIIGRLHLDGNSKLWEERPKKQRELSALVEILNLYQSGYQQNLNRLEGKLARHWPEVLPLLPLDSVTLEQLLIEYGTPREIGANAMRAKGLMRRVGRSGLTEEKIEAVLSSAMHSLGEPSIETEVDALQALLHELQHLRLLKKKAQRRVEKASVEDQGIRCLSDVVGRVTAAVIVAKLGDSTDYASSDSYMKAMGLNLKEKSSGKHKGQKKISKRGPSLVRLYLYFVALRLVRKDPVVRAWYEKKVGRDGGKLKMKGLVAVMRKVAKALWYVGHGEAFDSSRLFNRAALDLD